MEIDDEGLLGLSARLGHSFADRSLLVQALSHRSWCGEHPGTDSNERLEFLGDAVLGLVVAEESYAAYPELPEGKLAKIRAAVVNAHVLAEVAVELGLGDVLLVGKGEEASGGRTKASILADALEAVIGAVYLDANWPAAKCFVLRVLGDRVAIAAKDPGDFDHKSLLQELTVRLGSGAPRYEIQGAGPEHERRFLARVLVDGQALGTGEGPSKKEAEQAAAKMAWEQLRDA